MKIRNGYVSNSSSSSFMIIYKNIIDFVKLKQFKGYKTFIQDIKTSTMQTVPYISSMLYVVLYDICESYTKTVQNDVNIFEILDLFEMLEKDCKNTVENKYFKIIRELYSNGFEFRTNNFQKEYDQASQTYMENFRNNNKYRNVCDSLAKTIVKNIKKQNLNISIIRYYDEDTIGCYMENGFMPFIAKNPERKYEIWTSNEH